ncbi:hypothetical protein TIFTF001_018208 [Ficus carica]|uniref:Leucine-rich repeat-containing N-terminal plant-type domain-containing protein n=1 Tax=Ficus carica TaxID=3494 RepID=A0AA88AB08_FICCA|nr:hypothetical protein TIFTF001_018208 [Ficus carica]
MQKHLLILLLHDILLLFLPFRTTSTPRTQAEALLKWKNNLSSSPSTLNSWSLTNVNCLCNWTSIVCDNSTVEISQINLTNLNLTGTLDQFDFTPFQNITAFNLSNNNLLGTRIGTCNFIFASGLLPANRAPRRDFKQYIARPRF